MCRAMFAHMPCSETTLSHARPAMDLKGKPVPYKGGVIYTDLNRKLYRCYLKRGDRIEKVVSFGSDRAAAWERALNKFP
jgi:hypothetical protein